MWRYPALSAMSTARSVSSGAACHVPKPTAGIFAPVLRVKCVGRGMLYTARGFLLLQHREDVDEGERIGEERITRRGPTGSRPKRKSSFCVVLRRILGRPFRKFRKCAHLGFGMRGLRVETEIPAGVGVGKPQSIFSIFFVPSHRNTYNPSSPAVQRTSADKSRMPEGCCSSSSSFIKAIVEFRATCRGNPSCFSLIRRPDLRWKPPHHRPTRPPGPSSNLTSGLFPRRPPNRLGRSEK